MSAPTMRSPGAEDLNAFDSIQPPQRGEPTWNLALLYPFQGDWTEAEYLALHTKVPIELSDGCLEFLPMPTPFHQRIAQFLFKLLEAWVSVRGMGEVYISPLRVRLWSEKIREPDIVFLRPGRIRDPHRPPDGADLAIEIVSAGKENEARDYEVKRQEYAKAGIQEYWIVDPQIGLITVFTLEGAAYRELGRFAAGQQVESKLLPGFVVDVAAVFAAGNAPASRA